MAKRKKKSGTTMLRMSPEVHARADRAATALGMSLNGLLNLMVRTTLPLYEMQADMLQDEKIVKILREWSIRNPTRGLAQFFADYLQLIDGRAVRFENMDEYALDGDKLRRVLEWPPTFQVGPESPETPGAASGELPGDHPDDIPF